MIEYWDFKKSIDKDAIPKEKQIIPGVLHNLTELEEMLLKKSASNNIDHTKYCTHCGVTISVMNARFCLMCGTKVIK